MSVSEIYVDNGVHARSIGKEEPRHQSRGGEALCCWFTSWVGRTLVLTLQFPLLFRRGLGGSKGISLKIHQEPISSSIDFAESTCPVPGTEGKTHLNLLGVGFAFLFTRTGLTVLPARRIRRRRRRRVPGTQRGSEKSEPLFAFWINEGRNFLLKTARHPSVRTIDTITDHVRSRKSELMN